MERRDAEPAVAAAVPVIGHGERRHRSRVGLLALQAARFFRVCGGRVDDLQQPTPQDAQRLRVMDPRLVEQEPGGLDRHPRLDILGKRVDRRDDHRRLVRTKIAGRKRRTHRLVVLQRSGEAGGAVGLGPGRTRGVGPPVRRRRRPRVQPRLDTRGVPQDRHQQLVELPPRLRQQHQRVTRLGSGQRPQRRLRETGQLLATPSGEGRHRVLIEVLES